MSIWLNMAGERIEEARFETDGCEPSVASGSMACVLAQGKSVSLARQIGEEDILKRLGGLPEEHAHCALLASQTLRAAYDASLDAPHREDGPSACESCDHANCATRGRQVEETDEAYQERMNLCRRLNRIRHRVVVLSGKGGVGKSTVAVNMAMGLARDGYRVGLLDVDIHGPSVTPMLGLEGMSVMQSGGELLPVEVGGVKVISLGLLLEGPDDAVIWRGPMKMGVIRQFLTDVNWGDLDYLIIDSPPGTGDEPLSVCQLVGELDGAILVSTPQRVAAADVRRSVSFCRQLKLRVLGVVENMSGFVCPDCGRHTEIFPGGQAQRMADEMKVPFIARIPFEPQMALQADQGEAYLNGKPQGAAAEGLERVLSVLKSLDAGDEEQEKKMSVEEKKIRVAVPLAEGRLTSHFGHCASFALLDLETVSKRVISREDVPAPPHQPGLLPPWLAERGVGLIIAGGMGQRAQDLFRERGIEVLVGAPCEPPEVLALAWLEGNLQTGTNACDH